MRVGVWVEILSHDMTEEGDEQTYVKERNRKGRKVDQFRSR